MRTLRIHDTLSGGVREVVARSDASVGIYACGPTVYGPVHVGNARPYVVFSMLKRFLEHEGYVVTYVVNVTDVNDKIYAAAREAGVQPSEVNVKFATNEGMGFVGRGEGIATLAVASVERAG